MSDHPRDEETVVEGETQPVEAKPAEPRPCPVPVRPGYAQSAYRAGCEDEWIDRMQSRYGGEW